jgi:streptogramin lyase
MKYTSLLSALTLLVSVQAHAQIITTVAGNENGWEEENTVATEVKLHQPYAIAADNAGNIYFSEPSRHVVRKIDAHGILTTVVGDGTMGTDGNGGPAINAQLVTPCGLAVDGEGNLYIADRGNNVIRRVNKHGIINTAIGCGSYVINGHSGSSPLAFLDKVFDIATDQRGTLYISDAGNNAIKRIDTGGHISVVVGGFSTALPTGGDCGYTGDLWYPENARLQSVAANNEGDVYIADYWDKLIRIMTPSGALGPIAGNQYATEYGTEGCNALSVALAAPRRVVVDHDGNVIFTDVGLARVRKVDHAGKITTVAGGGSVDEDGILATHASVGAMGLAIEPSGNLLIADITHNRIRRVNIASVGTQQVHISEGMQLYPNPNNGMFEISGIAANGEARVDVTDITGRVIYTKMYSCSGILNAKIALPAILPNGMYNSRVTADGKVYVNRFSVER